MICGIDEAGRGPVIGPLVIAGVSTSERNIKKFVEGGVKDSKKLSREKREELFNLITKNCRWHAIKVSPAELDNLMAKGKTLNKIEAIKFGEVINALRPRLAVIDSADVNPWNFRRDISRALQCSSELLVEHKADENYPIVSAASIIAKVERDREMDKINERHRVGSGYPSDPVTIKFLEEWYRRNKSFPDFVRKSWKTLDLITNAKISDFL